MQFIYIIFFFFSLCMASAGTSYSKSPIIINEILFNPTGTDAGKEWIELANPSNETISVSGWTILNKTGKAIAILPNWDMPGNSYLIVHFGNGTNNDNFRDGTGHYFTNSAIDILNNTKDECGLFNTMPSNSSIIDFVSWSRDGSLSEGESYSYALSARRWISGDYLNINWTENNVTCGESIGRDRNSTDTNKADDWSTHGGINAYFKTPGSANRGPLFSVNDGIHLTQTEANIILIHYGFDITNSSHKVVGTSQNESETLVKAIHNFNATYGNNTILFNGMGIFHWKRINLSSSKVDIKINLSSDYGEQITIDYSSAESKSNNLFRNAYEIINCAYHIQNRSFNYHEESKADVIKLGENTFLTRTNQSIYDDSRISYKRIFEKAIIHSDIHRETWINGTGLSNLGKNTTYSVHFKTYYNSSDPSAYELIFDKYDIKDESGKNLTLVDKGYYKKNNINMNLSKIS
jgi:hypothetical protein